MSDLPIFSCVHKPEYRLEYLCKETGNYVLELCSECMKSESSDFLVKKEEL